MRSTATERIAGAFNSRIEEGIPRIPQGLQVILNDFLNAADFGIGKPAIPGELDVRIEPKLCVGTIPRNVNVSRFTSVTRIEMQAIWSTAKNGRHGPGAVGSS
jgi:hypothetical protein